jgi:hypothetical protein
MRPNTPRNVPRLSGRLLINDIFRVLRSGPPWRILPDSFSPRLNRADNLVERFFTKTKQCRRIAKRYDAAGANGLGLIQLASTGPLPRASEPVPERGQFPPFTRNLCSAAALLRDPLRHPLISSPRTRTEHCSLTLLRWQGQRPGVIAGGTMVDVLSGLALLLITAFLFWKVLPRNGQRHYLAATIWAPYVSIGLTSGLAFGVAMTVAGVVKLFV